MKTSKLAFLLPVLLFGISGGISGCMSMQNSSSTTTMEAIDGAVTKVAQPYVEAYLEYPGPNAKWAGPGGLIVHVVAKDSGAAQISTTPPWFTARETKTDEIPQNPPKVASRGLASTGLSMAIPQASSVPQKKDVAGEVTPPVRVLSGEEARERLRDLAAAIQGPDQKFRGCLSPVRVRLVRADGALLEKTGCRSDKGWAYTASEATHFFLTSAVYGRTAGN